MHNNIEYTDYYVTEASYLAIISLNASYWSFEKLDVNPSTLIAVDLIEQWRIENGIS